MEGLEAGADDYLAKPFRADELIARVRVALERAAGRSAARTAERAAAAAPLPLLRCRVRSRSPCARESAADAVGVPGRPRRQHGDVTLGAGPACGVALPGGGGVDPGAAPAAARAAGRRRASSTTRRTTCCWRRARRRRTRSSTRRTRPSRSSTSPCTWTTAQVRIAVRDYGQWRERMPSMDRGRGGTLMSAFGEITATPSPEGTTVTIVSPRAGDRSDNRRTTRRQLRPFADYARSELAASCRSNADRRMNSPRGVGSPSRNALESTPCVQPPARAQFPSALGSTSDRRTGDLHWSAPRDSKPTRCSGFDTRVMSAAACLAAQTAATGRAHSAGDDRRDPTRRQAVDARGRPVLRPLAGFRRAIGAARDLSA